MKSKVFLISFICYNLFIPIAIAQKQEVILGSKKLLFDKKNENQANIKNKEFVPKSITKQNTNNKLKSKSKLDSKNYNSKTQNTKYKPKQIIKKSKINPTKRNYISKHSKLAILSIRIGQDRPYKEELKKNQIVPIVITITSTPKQHFAKLKIIAQNIKTSQKYLIKFLELFQLNNNWSQAQFNWQGFYYNKNKQLKKLKNAKYKIIAEVEVLDQNKNKTLKKISRKWGYQFPGYNIVVKN